MKNPFFLFLILLFVGCNQSNDTNADTSYKCPFTNEIIFKTGGDYLGFTLGDDFDAVEEKDEDKHADGEDEFPEGPVKYYSIYEDQYDVFYDLYFNEKRMLESIECSAAFYNDEDDYDTLIGNLFFQDIYTIFSDQYGTPDQELSDEWSKMWLMQSKEVELNIDEGEVYWSIYTIEKDI